MEHTHDANSLAAFFAAGRRQQYNKKEIVLCLRDNPQETFWIVSGYVKVCRYNNRGSTTIVHIYRPEELFPITGLLGQAIYDVYFETFSSAVIYRRSTSDVMKFLDQHPRLYLGLLRQQTELHNPILYLHMHNAEQKVVSHLLHLTDRFGHQDGQLQRITLPLTQQDFADGISMSRETAGRILTRLETGHYIVRSRQFTMVDKDRLLALRAELDQS